MAIKRRYAPMTPAQKHAWRIDNAKRHVEHFAARKDEHRLAIWTSVLRILEQRTSKEVIAIERKAERTMELVAHVFVRRTIRAHPLD